MAHSLTLILIIDMLQDRDESAGSDSTVKKRRGEESSDKHRIEKNGTEEKRKSSSDRKR